VRRCSGLKFATEKCWERKSYDSIPFFFQYVNKQRFFVADFYCHEHRLVIEIDGKSHEYQKQYDELRTHLINNLGIKVVRFRNEEIEKNVHSVIEKLKMILTHSKSPPACGVRAGLSSQERDFHPFSS